MKKKKVIIQRGENPKYPETIKVWKVGDPVPEWMSDVARVGFIDGNGNISLKVMETNTGGLEIQSSDGSNILVRLERRNSLVCYSPGYKIFSLTPGQFDLLYKEIEK